MSRACIICGEKFESAFPHQRTCCLFCRREYNRRYQRGKHRRHKGDVAWYDRQNELARKRYHAKKRPAKFYYLNKDKIRQLIAASGLEMRQLSLNAGLYHHYMSNRLYDKSRVRMATINRLAEIFDVKPEELIE